jgi:tRNA dimethylallyltransferase
MMAANKALVVCGPTASGKSDLSDAFADALTERYGSFVPTLAVDSMQVYREIPTITNQERRRPAEFVGIVPVTEEWTVARHAARAGEIISTTRTPFVLDAGTGMYLNAIILDVPLAPKVSPETRRLAESLTAGAQNPRRAARQRELELSGDAGRRSIWDGDLRHDTALVYLRPDRDALDAAIERRSRRIVDEGLREAELLTRMLKSGARMSASVLDSIGVRELLDHLSGEISADEAALRISTRTRQLARRQGRWFDKLARTLRGRAPTTILEDSRDISTMSMNTMHDTMWA